MFFITYLILAVLLSNQSFNVISKRVVTTTQSAFTFNGFNSSSIDFDYDHEIGNLEVSGNGDVDSENEDYYNHKNHYNHEDSHDIDDHDDRDHPDGRDDGNDQHGGFDDHDDRHDHNDDHNKDRPDDLIIENVSLSPRLVVLRMTIYWVLFIVEHEIDIDILLFLNMFKISFLF